MQYVFDNRQNDNPRFSELKILAQTTQKINGTKTAMKLQTFGHSFGYLSKVTDIPKDYGDLIRLIPSEMSVIILGGADHPKGANPCRAPKSREGTPGEGSGI